jgi:RNA 2',3'-cyclic 3'-phosphodiesterase
VIGAGTVEGGDRLRLFLALPVPGDVLGPLETWQRAEVAGASIRTLAGDHLHVTLAFLGSRPAGELPEIASALRRAAAAASRPRFRVVGYRETRAVAMLLLGDEDERAGRLALDLHERLERLGVYRRERRPWLPHLTVARFRERPRLRPALPDLGVFAPSEAAAYLSRLHPSGARYEVLESVPLGG